MRALISYLLPETSLSSAGVFDNYRITGRDISKNTLTVAARSRKVLLSALLLAGATSAYAQDAQPMPAGSPTPAGSSTSSADPAPVDPAPDGDVITITGSRIVRNGYDAPTPVTVIGLADIQAAAPANVADLL